VEILPSEKAKEKNTRFYQFANVLHFFSTAQDNQHFNKKLYNLKTFNAVGVSFQYGGFDEMVRRLTRIKGATFFTGDVSKWDKRFRVFLIDFCRRMRVNLYRGQDPEYSYRMEFQYKNETYVFIVLSNGQVIYKAGSQLSGKTNTTSDNVMAHMLIMIAYILFMCDTEETMSLNDVYKVMEALLYADDQIVAVNPSWHFITPFSSRAEFYNRFGMFLKQSDDVIQDHVEGLVFLGATIKSYYGKYVPVYNRDRLEAGLVFPKGDLDVLQEYGKALAIYFLAAFVDDEKFIHNLFEYLVFLHEKTHGIAEVYIDPDCDDLLGIIDHAYELKLQRIPYIEEVREYFWLGHESHGVVPYEIRTQTNSEENSFGQNGDRQATRKLLWKWLVSWQATTLNF